MDPNLYEAITRMGVALDAQGIAANLSSATIAAMESCIGGGVHPEEISWAARMLGNAKNPDAVIRERLKRLAELPEQSRVIKPTPTPPTFDRRSLGAVTVVPPTAAYLAAKQAARLRHTG